MKISLLIPCHNEGKTLERSIQSWLAQSRPADEIVVVDDCSSDATPYILDMYKDRLTVVRTPFCTGNKSGAQEYGLKFVTGDVFATTDGDTILHENFLQCVEKAFEEPEVAGFGGQVKSLEYNWITACRGLDYLVGHNFDKVAQDRLGYMFVIPGAVGAFRTRVFREEIGFDHDTLTEDLDFTYKLHKLGYKIKYDRNALCYTQDPPTFSSYVNQMRRWFGGGWQCFLKHARIPTRPGMALELPLVYVEGFIFSILAFVLPFLNLFYTAIFLVMYLVVASLIAIVGAVADRRADFLVIVPAYVFLKYVNAYIYLEQFVKEVLLGRKNLVWFQPERVQL